MNRIKKKIIFYKKVLVEILETLCSICLYLEFEGRFRRNPHFEHMRTHFMVLKEASKTLREEIYEH